MVHGTTLATNALIERKGARTALVTTEGFRDSLEIAWEHRFEQYDIYMERPEPLVPRDLRFGVPERVAADGAVLLPLDEAAVRSVGRASCRRAKIEAVAVCFLHSFTNEAHERRAGAILAEELPGVADLALLRGLPGDPRVRARLDHHRQRLCAAADGAAISASSRPSCATAGIAGPLLLMMSSGGITTVDTARRYPGAPGRSPARPAAPSWRSRSRPRTASTSAVAFDMGGTTAKLTLIDDLDLQRSRQFEVARAYRFVQGSGMPVRIPVIELVEIGAGGGSIARIDALGRIQVGPDSAGSVPGPGLLRPRRHRADRHRCRHRARPARSGALRRRQASRSIPTRPRRRSQSIAEPLETDARAPRSASPRSSTRPWRAPRASMPSRTARTPPTAR